MKQLALIFLCVLCFVPRQSLAQSDQTELTWQNVLNEAHANHPDLVSSREKLNQIKAARALTKSNALPQISSNLSADRSKSAASNSSDSYAYGVNAKQLLFDGFKTTFDIKEADANIKAAQYNYAVTSSNVRFNLRIAFIDLLNAQQSLLVAQDIEKRRRQNWKMVNLRYEGGSEHKGSLMTEEANLSQAQFDIAQAQRNIELSQRRLVKAIGWREYRPIVVKGDLTISAVDKNLPPYEEMIKTIPLLQELVAQKESARLGVNSAKADFFPQIYANASAGRSDNRWPPGQSNWSAGFSVTFPLFEGGAQQARLAQAKAALGQAQAEERSGRDGVIFTLADTWTQWQDGVDNVGVQIKFLEAAKQRAKIAEAQYGAGLVTFNDWIIIENDLVNNQKLFLSAQANALIAEANWIQAKGVTLDE